ncbi:fibronectin type III domain-containing protein [Actinoplanes philippinensis]|uniref:fibronectin type III domain-containing protein n=1 Tax=Actinoplanes philippinensis TaxID=35752 RepID=UPI0033D432F4
MPSRTAAITLLAALPLGFAPAQTPDDLPDGAWGSTCAAPESVYCIASATITPAGGAAQPVDAAGLAVSAATLSDDYGDWVRWSVENWADKPAAVTGGTVELVLRTGTFVPRFTNATAAGLRVTRTVADGKYELTIRGRATPTAWRADTDCTAGYSCGDSDTTADTTAYRFEGRTQDLEGSPGFYTTGLDGAYLATDAQARSDLLTYDTGGTPPVSLGVLGNPQLDAGGEAVRNFVTLFLPGPYLAAAGTSAAAAASTGFDLVTSGDATVHQRVTATADDGGVRLEAPDVGLGADLATAAFYPRAPQAGNVTAPGAPQSVQGAGGTGTAVVFWQPPSTSGGSAVTRYRARAYATPSGGAVVGSCETAESWCTIDGLDAGGTYHVAVSAVNNLGEGDPASRVAVIATAVPQPEPSPSDSPSPTPAPPGEPEPGTPALPSPGPTGEAHPPYAPQDVEATPGARRIAVAWVVPDSDGGSPITGYTARAFPAATGGAPVASCQAPAGRYTCVLTGLTGGRTLFVEVTATSAAGTGPASARVAATPWTVPGAPRSVTAKSSDRKVTAGWKAPASNGGSAITGYRAEVSGKSGVVARCTAPAAGRTCTIKKLKKGTTLTLRVLAVNSAGVSAPSKAVKIKVKD